MSKKLFLTDVLENKDYFTLIDNEHKFQALTESNKQGNALRTGIYLSHVKDGGEESYFNLLRCSTNFRDGPTDNFRATDLEILDLVNAVRQKEFPDTAEFNHVLAQIYHNQLDNDTKKQHKARISVHSDKTKDMPANGMMAFCTFYKGLNELKNLDENYCYKNITALTTLRFRKKKDVTDRPELEDRFDIVLKPNSVFMITLETNRLYTHEISPSKLEINMIPTRMGYVIRCSNTNAIHKDGQTFIEEDNKLIPMEPPTEEGINRLKEIYRVENLTSNPVEYKGFYFSLNEGDYLKPLA